MTNEIILGRVVRDKTTGYTGVAIQLLYQLNGNVQVGIQPEVDPDIRSYPDAMFIDHHQIETPSDHQVVEPITPAQTSIKLGQEVEDKVTGFRGIATSKSIYLNGCVSFFVERKNPGKDEEPNKWIDHGRLNVVGDGVLETVKPPETAPGEKKPGGPAQRVTNRH